LHSKRNKSFFPSFRNNFAFKENFFGFSMVFWLYVGILYRAVAPLHHKHFLERIPGASFHACFSLQRRSDSPLGGAA
jgi:hypothetical protein